jgi:hypothetical protein
MDNKYYTPSIEEFHVGFECEIQTSWGFAPGVWPEIFYEDTLAGHDYDEYGNVLDLTRTSMFRVKYLDKEDIESLGFKYNEIYDYWYKFIGQAESIEVRYLLKEKVMQIIYEDATDEYTKRSFKFNGTIKNITEFKNLMKQLNI